MKYLDRPHLTETIVLIQQLLSTHLLLTLEAIFSTYFTRRCGIV